MLRLVILFSVLFSFKAFAVIYSNFEIENVTSSEQTELAIKRFSHQFFTSKEPQAFIKNFIDSDKSKLNPLVMEYKLYALLTEVAFHSQQDFLTDFVGSMKNYENKAFKIHEEGRVPVAVFGINAKAKGIENIWLASSSFNHYSWLLNQAPIVTVTQLRNDIASLSNPRWHGLKKSIPTLSVENNRLLSEYFIEDIKHLDGLDKFVSHYALITSNEELVAMSLPHLNKSQGEYLLKNLQHYFSEAFVVDQLIMLVDNNKHKPFAISMMGNYLENPDIQNSLLNSMNDETSVIHAARVLAKTNNSHTLNQLKLIFQNNDSELIKKQVVFALKMNPKSEAKTILNQLPKLVGSKNWTESFDRRNK